jgi:hypothetical protein
MEGIHVERLNEGIGQTIDKELLLQTLTLNNVPALELVDLKSCTYPVVGRKYGHHEGKDLSIVYTQDQAMEERADYLTKLYWIEKEYRLVIAGLHVLSAQEAKAQQMVFNEIPVRTASYGWTWQDINPADLPLEWLSLSTRALYVTGLTNGYVKIGQLMNQTAIVIDIQEAVLPLDAPLDEDPKQCSIGADIEFMLRCDGELVAASHFFPVEGPVGCDDRQIEQDSGEYALAEIRPKEAIEPHELFNNIHLLIEDASMRVPFANVEFLAGSMPFSGYQCGGHIHFGVPITLPFLRALDEYLAIPMAMVEESYTARQRRKTKHGGLGRYRVKPYGFEYLSLSSWIVDPQITLAVLCLASLIATHHHEMPCSILFEPVVQRAYYQGNQMLLKRYWHELKKRITQTSGFFSYERELSILFDRIESGDIYNEAVDIRRNWGFQAEHRLFDRGLVIQVPKKIRTKCNLQDGQMVHVRVGKSLTSATIRAYPFSFMDANRVSLSKSLCETLSIPKDWNPKIHAHKGVLSLGPVLGILANRPFERQASYFQHLSRLAKEKQMLLYVFEPGDIHWEKMQIRGSSIYGEGIYPFPSVVYDRYFAANMEQVQTLSDLRYKLQSVYEIPFINPPSLFQITGDKWSSHLVLTKSLQDHLPDTRLLETLSDVMVMLDRYGEIFLKPSQGAFGRGVLQIVRRPSGIYWMRSGERLFKKLTKMEELESLVTTLKTNETYLIQEGIRRKQLGGNHVEIRVYMQKNGQQKWVRTGMVTRLTSVGVLTDESEINRRSSQVLDRIYPNVADRNRMREQLAEVAKSVVLAIEEVSGAYGEVAIDLCIDAFDFVRILEINSKPDNLFSQIKAYKLRNLAGNRLLNYAVSLAGYNVDES